MQCTPLEGQDIIGGELEIHEGSGDAATCCSHCAANDLCAAFTIRGTTCYLKASSHPMVVSPDALSGVPKLCPFDEADGLQRAVPCHEIPHTG